MAAPQIVDQPSFNDWRNFWFQNRPPKDGRIRRCRTLSISRRGRSWAWFLFVNGPVYLILDQRFDGTAHFPKIMCTGFGIISDGLYGWICCFLEGWRFVNLYIEKFGAFFRIMCQCIFNSSILAGFSMTLDCTQAQRKSLEAWYHHNLDRQFTGSKWNLLFFKLFAQYSHGGTAYQISRRSPA